MFSYIAALEPNSGDVASLEKFHNSTGRCFVIGSHCNPLEGLWHR